MAVSGWNPARPRQCAGDSVQMSAVRPVALYAPTGCRSWCRVATCRGERGNQDVGANGRTAATQREPHARARQLTP